MDDWQFIAILLIVTLAIQLVAIVTVLVKVRSLLTSPSVLHKVPHQKVSV